MPFKADQKWILESLLFWDSPSPQWERLEASEFPRFV